MPLVRAEVRNEYGLGAAEMYREANREEPTEILQGVAMAGLVGLLRQLGDLSDFAAQVFHGLQEELGMVSSRSRVLKSRIRRSAAALSPLEKVVLAQRSHLHFAYIPRCDWHARRDCRKHNFVYTDVPEYIRDSYEECPEPPRLHLLDRFDSGGPGSCFKRYSDPLFFKNASKSLQVKNQKRIDRSRSLVQRQGSVCTDYNLLETNIADARKDAQNDLTPAQGDCSSWYIPWVCNPELEFVDVDFEDEKDIFMDAPYAIKPDQFEIDLNFMRERDAQQGSKLEVIKPNLENQTSYSECIGLANRSLAFGSRCNPISMSLKSSFAAFCCISARDGCDSVSPVANSYSNWGTRSSLEQQKPALVPSDFAPISSCRNGNLLCIEQSKPPDCILLNDLENQDETKSSAYQENEEISSSFRTIQSKISVSDLGINLERTIGLVNQNNSNSFAETESGHAVSGQTKDPSAAEFTMPSPPLRHMKVPFQPIDGFEISTRKLKCTCGISKDGCCTHNLPLFQLVPEAIIARQHDGSDSDNDTSYMSSPSLLDGYLSNENSESNSERWEPPSEKGPDLCSNLKALNYSFIEESRNDTNSLIPPIVWYNLEPNMDYTFNLNENSNGQTEANKGEDRDEKDDHFLQLIRS